VKNIPFRRARGSILKENLKIRDKINERQQISTPQIKLHNNIPTLVTPLKVSQIYF
jgi:hypothetical protein